jgi:hypothetical protein
MICDAAKGAAGMQPAPTAGTDSRPARHPPAPPRPVPRQTRRNQPEICQWNCAQLANSLLAAGLVEKEEAEEVLGEYAAVRPPVWLVGWLVGWVGWVGEATTRSRSPEPT